MTVPSPPQPTSPIRAAAELLLALPADLREQHLAAVAE